MEPFPPGPPLPPAAAGIPKEQAKHSAKRSKKADAAGKATLGSQESQTIYSLKNKYISKGSASRLKESRNGNEYQIENTGEQQRGIMKTKEGRVFYGTFRNYIPHGRGVLERPIGPEVGYIDGEWNNGKLSGPVDIYSPMGHIYSGFWENDKWLENKATLKLKNGDVYVGSFSKEPNKQLDKEGRGVLTTKNKVYEGVWRNDKFCEGKIMFLNDPELKEYEGEVKSDAFNGKGVLTYKDGRRIEGTFINGVCSEGKFSRILENGQIVDHYQGKLNNHFPPHFVQPPAAAASQPQADQRKRKKSSAEPPSPPPANAAPVPKAPSLPPLSELVNSIPGHRVQGHYENDRIIYDGEFANNKFDGMGILVIKNTHMLEDLGIPDTPRFGGLFLKGIAFEGLGVQEILAPDRVPRLSYGIFKEGRLHTGVGFVLTERGISCGVFQDGRQIRGREYFHIERIPTTQEIFLEYLIEAIATYRQLNQK